MQSQWDNMVSRGNAPQKRRAGRSPEGNIGLAALFTVRGVRPFQGSPQLSAHRCGYAYAGLGGFRFKRIQLFHNNSTV